jgi:hypothetical protein
MAGWAIASCGGAEFAGGVDGGGGGSTGGSTGTTTNSTGGSTGDTTVTVTTGMTTGGPGSGGSGGAGGSTGTGGSGGGSCSNASVANVTFRLIPGGLPNSPGYCVGSCGASWVTIKTPDGHVVGNLDHGCFASCGDCQPVVCPAIACVAPHRLASGGEDRVWNGTLWAQSTCSSGSANLACVNQVCVQPGMALVATMCGFPNMTPDGGGFCSGGPTPKCVDVPFTYPTMNVVTGVLDPVR